jgi:hypothetical protein
MIQEEKGKRRLEYRCASEDNPRAVEASMNLQSKRKDYKM